MLSTKQILLTILSTSSAVTAAVIPRQASSGIFSITDLFIGAINTPSEAVYEFSIADTSATPSNFTTYCQATTSSAPGLTTVPSTLCDDESVSFSFSNNGTGYILTFQHLWGEDVQHAIVLAHDDFTDSAAVFWPNDVLVNGQTEAGGPFLAKINTEPDFEVAYSRFA